MMLRFTPCFAMFIDALPLLMLYATLMPLRCLLPLLFCFLRCCRYVAAFAAATPYCHATPLCLLRLLCHADADADAVTLLML